MRRAPTTPAEHGRALEATLQQWHRLYQDTGRAAVRRLPHEVIERAGSVRARIPRGADFTGALAPSGRAVAFDAKSRATSTVTGLRDMSPVQWEHMDATARCGGLSFLLVEVREVRRRWFIVPVIDSRRLLARSQFDLDKPPEGVTAHSNIFGPDWLMGLQVLGLLEPGASWPEGKS